MKPVLLISLLLVLQSPIVRCQTDEDDIDYRKEYEDLRQLYKQKNEAAEIAIQLKDQLSTQLRDANEKVAALENRLRNLNSTSGSGCPEIQHTQCPKGIGGRSACKELGSMGCYCIVEDRKPLAEAVEYCSRFGMQLVAIETKEENDLLVDFLTANLGTREKYSYTSEYSASFMTSGWSENVSSQWTWTSSKQPLLFRNWGWNTHVPGRQLLFVKGVKPFRWIAGFVRNEDRVPYSDHFICESGTAQQFSKLLVPLASFRDCPATIGLNSTCAYLDPFGCYCVVETEDSWPQASRNCRSQGMELVSIESQAEHDQLVAYLRELGPEYRWGFWTSALYYNCSGGVWTATGQPLTFAQWEDGEPNLKNDRGSAVILNSSSYNLVVQPTKDDQSSFSGHYICEKSSVPSMKQTTTSGSCAAGKGWTCRTQLTGCYCHLTIGMNWNAAWVLCRSVNMQLISVASAEELVLIASVLPADQGWWTSGTEASSGQWIWAATERSMEFANWAQDEPMKVDSTEHAAAMSSEGWWVAYPKTKEYFPLCVKGN